jgi:lipocalin
LGEWYEIERFNVIYESDLKCVRVHYAQLNKTAVTVNNTGIHVTTGAFSQTFGFAQAQDPSKPNQLLVYLPIKLGNQTLFNNTAPYNVWKTDYKTYSLVYSCEQVVEYLLKYEIVWIISRQTTLDQNIIDNLKEFASNRTLDISKFEPVDQSCPE